MAKKITSLEIPFKDLDVDKQIQWLIKHSQKVIERLPTLKKELSVYDDKSNELYNMDKSTIELFTNTYAIDLTTGDISGDNSSLNDFVSQLSKYGDTGIGELRLQATNQRIESFIESIKKCGASEKEIEYVQSLLDKMSDRQKEAFTKSKLFWDSGDYGSEGIRTFMDLYDVTPATANLENWCEQHDIETQQLFYEEGETAKKRGRHKKKK